MSNLHALQQANEDADKFGIGWIMVTPGQRFTRIEPSRISVGAAETWLAVYVIEFSDDGPPEGAILHRGTKEFCIKAAETEGPLEYTGARPVKQGGLVVIEEGAYSAKSQSGTTASLVVPRDHIV